MSSLRGWVVATAVVLLLAGLFSPHVNLDDSIRWLLGKSGFEVEPDTVTIGTKWALVALAVLLSAGAIVVSLRRWWQSIDQEDEEQRTARKRTLKRGLGIVLTVGALLIAVYLPHFRFDDLVGWLWGESAADGEKADAVTWARWALVAMAILIFVLVLRRFALSLQLALVGLVVLVFVAGAAVTGEVMAALDAPGEDEEEDKVEAAFDRAFTVPAEKVQTVVRELARNRCITVLVATGVDPDTSDERNALVYETAQYPARLVTEVPAGKPSAGVEIALGDAEAEDFVSDLAGATAIHLLSTNEKQNTRTLDARRCT